MNSTISADKCKFRPYVYASFVVSFLCVFLLMLPPSAVKARPADDVYQNEALGQRVGLLAEQIVDGVKLGFAARLGGGRKVLAIAPVVYERDGVSRNLARRINQALPSAVARQIAGMGQQEHLSLISRNSEDLDRVWVEVQSFDQAAWSSFSDKLAADILLYPKVSLLEGGVSLSYEGVALRGERQYQVVMATRAVELPNSAAAVAPHLDVVISSMARDMYTRLTRRGWPRLKMADLDWMPLKRAGNQPADPRLEDSLRDALQARLSQLISEDTNRKINPREDQAAPGKVTIHTRVQPGTTATTASLYLKAVDDKGNTLLQLRELLRCADLPDQCATLAAQAGSLFSSEAVAEMTDGISARVACGMARNLARVRAVASKTGADGVEFAAITSISDGREASARLSAGFTYAEQWTQGGDDTQCQMKLVAKVYPLDPDLQLVTGSLNAQIFTAPDRVEDYNQDIQPDDDPLPFELAFSVKAMETVRFSAFVWMSDDTIAALPLRGDTPLSRVLDAERAYTQRGVLVAPHGFPDRKGMDSEAIIVIASKDTALDMSNLAKPVGQTVSQTEGAAIPMPAFLNALQRKLAGRKDVQILVLPYSAVNH